MAIPPEKIAELRVKQLEMVQSIVGRMAAYGANFKSYCITVTTAVCTYLVSGRVGRFIAPLTLEEHPRGSEYVGVR